MVTIEDIRKQGRLAYTSVWDDERKGWAVAVCVEGQTGFRVIQGVGPWPDSEWAEKEADTYNRTEGRNPSEVAAIIISTMRDRRRRPAI